MTATNASPSDVAKGGRPSDQLSDDQLVKMLYDMMLIRRFEEKTCRPISRPRSAASATSTSDREASAVGSISALKDDDPIVAPTATTVLPARGMHPNYCMAEMYGKITGCTRARRLHAHVRP